MDGEIDEDEKLLLVLLGWGYTAEWCGASGAGGWLVTPPHWNEALPLREAHRRLAEVNGQ